MRHVYDSLSVYLYVYLSVYLTVCLYLTIYMPVYLMTVCLTVTYCLLSDSDSQKGCENYFCKCYAYTLTRYYIHSYMHSDIIYIETYIYTFKHLFLHSDIRIHEYIDSYMHTLYITNQSNRHTIIIQTRHSPTSEQPTVITDNAVD